MNKKTEPTMMAVPVAAEDLKSRDYVAVLAETIEFPPFYWCDTMPHERDKMVRVRYLPSSSGTPVRVRSICLPFVFVESPCGRCETLDVRQVQLVRLKKSYARTVWKRSRKPRGKTKRHSG